MRISDWSSDVCSSDLGSWCCAVTPRSGTAPAGIGWILSAPAVVIIALLAILPSLHLLIEAFRSIDTEGLTLENFRSEEHTSELQSLMRISYAVFCLKQTIQRNYSFHPLA